jgi:transposase
MVGIQGGREVVKEERVRRELVNDVLWEEIAPLLPSARNGAKGGRPPADNRACLEGIAHVLRTGCQWQLLPHGPDEPSGSTCWRRFRDWTAAGVWPQVHRRLLNRLGQAGEIDLSVAVVDSASVRAKKGACIPGPTLSIAEKAAANATASVMPRGYRW